MNKEKSLEQFKKNINLMFENNDKEIYLHKDDALKIEYYIYSLEQQVKKQKEVIDKAIEYILECSINEKGHINVSLSSEEVGKLLDILNEALE